MPYNQNVLSLSQLNTTDATTKKVMTGTSHGFWPCVHISWLDFEWPGECHKNQVRLSNSKDTQDYTLLIATGISEVLWKTQIRLIDIKMERGTLFATQGPNRSHVLLLVCLNSLVGGWLSCWIMQKARWSLWMVSLWFR